MTHQILGRLTPVELRDIWSSVAVWTVRTVPKCRAHTGSIADRLATAAVRRSTFGSDAARLCSCWDQRLTTVKSMSVKAPGVAARGDGCHYGPVIKPDAAGFEQQRTNLRPSRHAWRLETNLTHADRVHAHAVEALAARTALTVFSSPVTVASLRHRIGRWSGQDAVQAKKRGVIFLTGHGQK